MRLSHMAALKYCVSVSFYLLVFLLGFLSSGIEAASTYSAYFCGNETYNSTTGFHSNLKVLLTSLSSNATQDGGYHTTAMGFGSTDAVNGLLLCRGDVNATICHDCVSSAAMEIMRRCPNQTEAIIWYVECMLRYTNRYFASQSIVPGQTLKNGTEIPSTNWEQFNQSLFSLLNGLVTNASESDRSFAVGEESFTSTQTLYALEQCTKDISVAQCKTCLENAIGLLPTCCGGQQGATVLLASCNVRYELFPFYNLTAIYLAPPSSGMIFEQIEIK